MRNAARANAANKANIPREKPTSREGAYYEQLCLLAT